MTCAAGRACRAGYKPSVLLYYDWDSLIRSASACPHIVADESVL